MPPNAVAVVPIRTTGDRILDRPSEAGGKGLFTKEIDDALLDGTINLAVHSAKDMPTLLPKGLSIVASLPRDAFISAKATRLFDLAEARSSEPRRCAGRPGTTAATPAPSLSYIGNAKYTLGIAGGRMAFLGVGGEIDGKVTPSSPPRKAKWSN